MKILIANRGEIAIRIMRACRELEFRTIAVYSQPDRVAPHVRYADEAYLLGPGEPSQSYLAIDRIIDVALKAGAEAVHPGYGFLAENAEFARACRDAGLLFIGPSPEVIARMGSKTAAREAAIAAGVPVVPGTEKLLDEGLSDSELATQATRIGFPLLIKAVAGGGGKGMRVAKTASDLSAAVRAARSEALSAFGVSSVYFERQLLSTRHIEVQLLGDMNGQVVAFVERECSIQRRYQKVLEESPSVAVDKTLRMELAEAATNLARAVGYTTAGTIEFLLDEDGHFYFLEMNTRLQVEHPVTEQVTRTDLVQWQIRLAKGEALNLVPEELLKPQGHSIECRIYAEDPDAGFLPSPGKIETLQPAAGPGVRDDSGVSAGFVVPVFYDSLLSKLTVWGENRAHAIARMRRALSEYEVGGVKTTIPFFQWLLTDPDFLSGRFNTAFLDHILATRTNQPFVKSLVEEQKVAVMGSALTTYLRRESSPGRVSESDSRGGNWKRAARLDALR